MLNSTHNKRRLYIAYYTRPILSARDPHRYHSGLLAFRKHPHKSDLATIFHATTSPGVPWTFETKHITPRTMRLVGLVYIGKLDHTVTDDILIALLAGNVWVNNADPHWNCLDWLYEALMVLESKNVLDPLPFSAPKLWKIGAHYTDEWRMTCNDNRQLIDAGTPIPCCDILGNPLPSPLS
ncbi:hypothetical protein APHAL10511_004250 [Amanita phalloides]|nr:hypothetical protein APHAL10511_004250 [Amanita phalloides]